MAHAEIDFKNINESKGAHNEALRDC